MEEVKKGRELTAQEDQEFDRGNALLEMDSLNPGWKIVKELLNDRVNHSWVDPRECKDEKEYVWQETNAFHMANAIKEIFEMIAKEIDRAQYLSKVKDGTIKNKDFKI